MKISKKTLRISLSMSLLTAFAIVCAPAPAFAQNLDVKKYERKATGQSKTKNKRSSKASKDSLAAQAKVIREHIITGGPYFTLRGKIKTVGNGGYSVNGERFSITEDTRITGTLRDGASAAVRGYIEKNEKIARVVTLGNPSSSVPELGEANRGDFKPLARTPLSDGIQTE